MNPWEIVNWAFAIACSLIILAIPTGIFIAAVRIGMFK